MLRPRTQQCFFASKLCYLMHSLRNRQFFVPSFTSNLVSIPSRPTSYSTRYFSGTSQARALVPLSWPGQSQKQPLQAHGIWLRDHCNCPACLHPVTLQRLVDSSAIPLDIVPVSISIPKMESLKSTSSSFNKHRKDMALGSEPSHISLNWPDGHTSTFSTAWLKSQLDPLPSKLSSIPRLPPIRPWGTSLLHRRFPTLSFDRIIHSDAALRQWLLLVHQYGIVFVEGTPANVQDTERLARRISYIRETHYGGFWDFSADMEHADTAYTNLALEVHTDTTYFTDPVGLQLFHLLHQGKGGDSLFVDGFYAAKLLRQQDPEAYQTLSTFQVGFECRGDHQRHICPTPTFRPILNLNSAGDLYQVRFNNDDRAFLDPRHVSVSSGERRQSLHIQAFYRALHVWTALLRRPDVQVQIPLKPGTAVILDNWRVLHGRTSFTGYRRMCGCYISYDEYQSKLATLSGISRSPSFHP